MDKTSKSISGLREGKIIIQKPNKYFTDSEKHQIIQELLDSRSTKAEIWQKYTGQNEEHGQLLRWMRKLGYDTPVPIVIGRVRMIFHKMWAHLGLNQGPPDYESGALTN
jgi:hypothetical protein